MGWMKGRAATKEMSAVNIYKTAQGVVFWLGVAALLAVSLIEATNMYPVLDGDAISFLPSALTYRKSGELVNRVYDDAKLWDSSGIGRLVHHGFLFQIVLGSIIPSPSYLSIRLAQVALLSISVVFSARQLKRTLQQNGTTPRAFELFGVGIALLTILCTAKGFDGRPELLVMVIAVCALEFAAFLQGLELDCVMGVAAGLMAATSPIPATLFFTLYGLEISRTRSGIQVFYSLLLVGAVSAVVFFLLFTIYPYSPADWFLGMWTHGKRLMARADHGGFWHYWFFDPQCPFLVLPFACLVAIGILSRKLWWEGVRSKLWFWVILALLSLLLWRFVLKSGERVYNVAPLVPLVLVLNFRGFINISRSLYPRGLKVYALRVIVILSLLGGVVGFVRSLLVFQSFSGAGLSYNEARTELDKLRSMGKGTIGLSSGLFTLAEDYSRIEIFSKGKSPDWLLMQQVNMGDSLPMDVPGYRLVRTQFSPVKPRLFGIVLANSPRAYNYALYEKIK